MRERADLQRGFCQLLHTLVVGAGMAGALLALAAAPNTGGAGAEAAGGGAGGGAPSSLLELVLQGVARAAAWHVDLGVRRTCVMLFTRLTGEWCGGGGGGGEDGSGQADAVAAAQPEVSMAAA